MTTAAPLTHPKRNPVRKHLLSGGIIRCGLCGNKLTPQPSPSGKAGYACRPGAPTNGCGKIRISAEGVENDVGKRVIARLASPSIRKRLLKAATGRDATGKSYVAQLAAVKTQMNELTDEWTAGTLPREQWVRATQNLKERERELEQLVQRSDTLVGLPADATIDALSNWWEETAELQAELEAAEMEEDADPQAKLQVAELQAELQAKLQGKLQAKRDLVLLMLQHVDVGPATSRGNVGFDKDRVTYIWR